jgi:hypothetical protein
LPVPPATTHAPAASAASTLPGSQVVYAGVLKIEVVCRTSFVAASTSETVLRLLLSML